MHVYFSSLLFFPCRSNSLLFYLFIYLSISAVVLHCVALPHDRFEPRFASITQPLQMFADMAKCNAAMLARSYYLLVLVIVASWYISIPIP